MTDVRRLVLADWQRGRLRWTDAVASLGLAGLPALYAAAYRHGVPIVRRFADEIVLPDLALKHDLTPAVWRANPAWCDVWYRDIDRRARTPPRSGSGPGHAQRYVEGLDRDVWWLVREQRGIDGNRRDMERMQRDAEADRKRHARLIIRKRLDRTLPHPELQAEDFIAAWLDGDVPIGELSERMGLTQVQVRRMRLAAAEAAAAELGRLDAEAEALAEVGRSTDELTIRAAIGVLLDWHVGALDLDEAVERLPPLGIPRLADAVRLAAADPPQAVFLFAPSPFVDLLEAYEAARRRRDLEYVVVVEAGHSVRVSSYSGSGAWSSRTFRL